MVVQFGFLKAIVTAEELFLPDPSHQEVFPFVKNLNKQFPCDDEKELSVTAAIEGLHTELPLLFDFQRAWKSLERETWITKEGTLGLSVFVESVSWVGKNIVITLGSEISPLEGSKASSSVFSFRVHIVRVGKHKWVESRSCSCVSLQAIFLVTLCNTFIIVDWRAALSPRLGHIG
ncbi:hypothetical protein MTR_1g055015 [Medicago truncatula]|uniref:Uncharacterized protein n=1 Tax=Medicago truncatula TaxID=3880 RepID=A0A072VK64_MEDTR|nr:hypothetical protein MTR_1g055015 [Medicago truncatula]